MAQIDAVAFFFAARPGFYESFRVSCPSSFIVAHFWGIQMMGTAALADGSTDKYLSLEAAQEQLWVNSNKLELNLVLLRGFFVGCGL